MTAMAKVSFNANAILYKNTAEVCTKVNREICQLLGEKSEHDLTVFFGILDTATGSFEYTSCAHQPAILLRKAGKTERLSTDDSYLGLLAKIEFTSKQVTLAKGDRLVLFTDGIVEAMNKAGDQYDEPRLLSVTAKCAGKSNKDYVDQVIADVDEFCSHAEPHDDRAILCVDYKG